MSLEIKTNIPVEDKSGDGPAHQATRLAVCQNNIFYADGPTLVSVHCESLRNDPNNHVAIKRVVNLPSRIQSIAAQTNGHVAIVDSLGNLFVSNGHNLQHFDLEETSQKYVSKESGWCGVAIHELNQSIAVSNMWSRNTFITGTSALFEHELPPTSLAASASQDGVYFVTEWNNITIWDSRASRGGLVERLIETQIGGGGSGPLWSTSSCENYFCVGGEDRTVSLYDVRKNRLVDTWRTPLKDDIVMSKLYRDRSNVLSCAVLGLDHEICTWNSGCASTDNDITSAVDEASDRRTNFGRLHHNHRVFRAKSRWSGMSFLEQRKMIGRDSEGTLYMFAIE